MRAVVQRVRRARVTVAGRVTGEIGTGLLCLVGVGAGDTAADADYLRGKLLGLRVFEDGEGKMNRDVREAGGALLLVSQFTLYGDVRKGRRPGFSGAMPPEAAEPFFAAFVAGFADCGVPVATGEFRATMDVELINDGPVTILIDSPRGF